MKTKPHICFLSKFAVHILETDTFVRPYSGGIYADASVVHIDGDSSFDDNVAEESGGE